MKMIRHILVPTDFTACSEAAFAAAALLAKGLAADITLLHVVDVRLPELASDAFAPMPDLVAQAEAQARESLEAARGQISGCGSVRTQLRTGAAWREILAEAKQFGADAIVMGTHGRGGIVRAVLGSTADKVVRKATVPVMTVHADFLQSERPAGRQRQTTRASRVGVPQQQESSHDQK